MVANQRNHNDRSIFNATCHANRIQKIVFSTGKMLLTMFLFQKWLGSSFPEDV